MSQRMADDVRVHKQGPGSGLPVAGIAIGQAWVLVAVLSALMLAIFHEASWSMVRVWINSRTYGHGFLIVPVAVWLAWQKRDDLKRLSVQPSLLGLVWIFGACVVWLFGLVSQANILQHLAMVGMIQGAVIAVMGTQISRTLIFPLGYLLFMVPFGDFAVAPLQDLTARYATTLLRFSGIPVYLENWSLVIPGGAFLVAKACAGVRFLIASIALGVLIAGTMFSSWWKRLLFVALSIAVPIGANVVRAYGIVVIAYVSDFEMAVGVDHIVYGFVFLSFVMFLLIGLAWLMRDGRLEKPATEETMAPVIVPPSGPATIVRPIFLAGVAALMVLGMRVYGSAVMASAEIGQIALVAPQTPQGWVALGRSQEGDWQGDFVGPDAEATWRYMKDGRILSVFIAYYGDEGPGKELVSTRNSLLGPNDAKIFESGRTDQDRFGRAVPSANYLILNDRGLQRMVWYWYVLEDKATAKEPDVKLAGLAAKLSGQRARGMVIAISGLVTADDHELVADFITGSDLHAILARGGFDGVIMPDTDN